MLKEFVGKSFEVMATVGIKELSLKMIFLVAVTLARRVSKLGALSTNPNLCIFHSDRVILRSDPAFIPKINSLFHRSQELVLPSFCPNPVHLWHTLDVCRVLRFYIDCTQEFRKTDSLFVSFRGASKGKRAALSCWLREAIVLAYKAMGKEAPQGILAHSIRCAAASPAFEG